MSVSVNNILDAGMIVHGKLPDVYWELNLTNSEMKVLRYVYNNCLRIYKNLKYFPKGKDGSPRFWRGKERMADDVGLSYSGFRSTVRHLHELGLVTSMDGDSDSEEPFCIGLSSRFLDNPSLFNRTVKSLRLDTLKDLIVLLYDNNTLELIETVKNIDKFPLITNVIKLVESQGFVDSTETKKNHTSKPSAKNTSVTRKPILVGRTPILLFSNSLRVYSAQEKLKQLQNVRTSKDKKLLEIADYYEFKCRQVLHSSGFKCLGKDFRNHKNWKYLERIHQLCTEKEWDYRIYIDAQFDRVRYWSHKQLYPYLNQFNSEGAIKYYQSYIKNYKEMNSITGDIKVKSQKKKSVNQQIIDDIIKDCEGITEYIEKAKKRRANKGLTEQQLKMLYLSDHWMSLSVNYLSSIPWFLMFLNQFPEETFLFDLKQDIKAIQSSKSMSERVNNTVTKVEKQMNIPETMRL